MRRLSPIFSRCLAASLLLTLSSAAVTAGVLRPATTLVTAHRGWLDPAQLENSIAQMASTTAAGAFMLEFDLKTDHDGDIYLLHDDSLDRTTDGHGAIATQSAQALAGVHLRYPDGRPSPQSLPRYTELLRWAAATPSARLMLDVKQLSPDRFMPQLLAAGLAPRSVVLTFDPASSQAMLAYAQQVLVSVLVTSPADIARYRKLAGAAPLAMYLPEDAEPALFLAAHRSGAVVISDAISEQPQGSLDQRAERGGDTVYQAYLAQRPIDILVSNHPQRVAALLARPPQP